MFLKEYHKAHGAYGLGTEREEPPVNVTYAIDSTKDLASVPPPSLQNCMQKE